MVGERLAGRVAVVTGAGSGIGRACALRFAGEGARVVVNDIDPGRAEATCAAIRELGAPASACPGDVSDAHAVARLVDTAVAQHGGLHALVNNAAAPIPGRLAETSDASWRQVLAVTLDGCFYGVREALRVMRPQGRGSIVNIASGAGLAAEPQLGAYGAAKAGVINLTKTAAVENAATGVRVNAISPGVVATPPMLAWADAMPGGREPYEAQIPARRMGRPEEIADAALFLASDESSYVTGAVLVVDGGVAARLASPR